MNRLSISNWSFTTKFAVPTAVSLLMIVFLAIVSHVALKGQVDRTAHIVEHDFQSAMTLTDANTSVQGVNGRFYQLLTFQAAEIDAGAPPAQAVAELAGDVEGILASLSQYREGLESAAERESIAAIEAELVTYKDTLGVVASMMEIDFASAVSFALPFAENYNKLLNDFDTLVSETVAKSRKSVDAGAAAAGQANIIQMGVALVALLASSLLAFLVGGATVRSIIGISDATKKLADGELTTDISALERGDELSAIVSSLEAFKANAIERNNLAAREREELSEREARASRVETLIKAFEADSAQVLEKVAGASGDLKVTAESMRETADGASRQSTTAADALGHASQDVEAVAAASEELSSSIMEISKSVEHSVDAVNRAAVKADHANGTMADLTDSARQIDDVVNLINDIAEQTNLLALNATIEAARAGASGKGFAVVANEVKTLANQTSQATSRVATSVAEIQRVTDTVAKAMQDIIETITTVTQISSEISHSVRQQGEATQEIATSVSRVSRGTSEVSETMTEVRMSASDTGVSADNVLDAASALASQAEQMRASVDRFLSGIRAA